MIETSLISLEDAIQEGIKLSAGAKAVLPSGDEAEIYGFIAIDNNPLCSFIDMPPLGECKVFSNRAIFLMDKQLLRFPIFQSVSQVAEERYGLYLLYIPKYLNQATDYLRRYYIESMSMDKPHPKVTYIDGVQVEENVAYYLPKEHDLYFESRSKLRGIGSGFVIITRRVSKLSDEIKYEVFDSHSVRMERNGKM